MPATFRPSKAAVGVAAAVALAAAAPALSASAATHHAPASHHKSSHAKHIAVKGLIAAHHGRNVTVFAKKVAAGNKVSHNKRIVVTFARHVHMSGKHVVGNRIHLSATGRMSGHHVTVLSHNDETVTTSPASLAFGTIQDINGNSLVVSAQNRDDGDNEQGGDRHDGGGDDGGNDNARPADHSPGGPGDGSNGNSGHRVVVDDTNAVITLDGSTDTALAVGDTVAVLGEYTDGEIVAADIFGFTNSPAFLRGDITAINGDNVTVGDDDQGEHHGGDDMRPARHGGDDGDNDAPVTVSLTNVPLALNGTLGATASDLAVGDKLVLLGSFDSTSGAFTADAAFGFNSDDQQPCGHNEVGDDGHDGGIDG